MMALKNNSGFTLIETILAGVILCASVLTIGAISTRSVTGTKLNRQYEMAAELANRQLTMIDYIGIENFIEAGNTEGEFKNFEPAYHWEVVTESQGIDNLYMVKITVSWIQRGHSYSVSMDTMLNGAGLLIEEQL